MADEPTIGMNDTEYQSGRFANKWQYGIAIGLALWIAFILLSGVVDAPQGGQANSIGQTLVSVVALSAWVLLPVSTYFDAMSVPDTSDWKPKEIRWSLLAAIPLVNLSGCPLYLYQRTTGNVIFRFGHEQQYDAEELAPLCEKAEGSSVTPEKLDTPLTKNIRIYDTLDEGEQPHYILDGFHILIGPFEYVIVTNERVYSTQTSGFGQEPVESTIYYDSINGVDVSGGLFDILNIHTPNRSYNFKLRTDTGELNRAEKYIRSNEQGSSDVESSPTDDDALDRLSKLKDLHENGTLSDKEFEKKKSELLEKV
jgi:hypothetical protein